MRQVDEKKKSIMSVEKKSRVLVIGGAGYMGSALCQFLYEKGYVVDVIDVLWFGNHLAPSISVIQKDAFNCTEVELSIYDSVLFLAGISTDPMAEFHPALNYIYNGALPAYVAYIAKRAGVKRFIFASSCSVYGHAADRFYKEDELVRTAYPYGIGKYQGEKGVMQLCDENFSVISLRFGTLSGHSPRMRMDLIVNTMFKHAMTEKCIFVYNPSIWRPICHIGDALYAYLRALQAPYSTSGVFNIASLNSTVADVADIVREKIQRLTGDTVKLIISHNHDLRNYKVSIEHAKNVLLFSPSRGVGDIVDDLIQHKEDYGDFSSESYYNLLVFKKLSFSQLFTEHKIKQGLNMGWKSKEQ